MLNIDDTALVVIDVQGKLAKIAYESEMLFSNLKNLIRGIQMLEVPIVLTEQLPDKLGPTNPEIANLLSDIEPINKDTFSCCGNDEFMKELTNLARKNILLCSIETHVCVYQTAVDLMDAGYNVHVLADAVSSRFKMNLDIGLERMKEVGACLTCVETVLFELLKVAKGDKFKEIIGVIK